MEKTVDNKKFYDILGIAQTADREEIAAAFRQEALLAHPVRNDKSIEGETLKKFSLLCQAYEILSDPLMKRIYDKYGEYSVMNGVQRGTDKFGGYIYSGNPYKIFGAFFGSENPFIEDPKPIEGQLSDLAQVEQEARAEDILVTVECELFEFYNGAVKEINYTRRKMLAATEAFQKENQRLNVTVLPGYSESTTLTFSGMGH